MHDFNTRLCFGQADTWYIHVHIMCPLAL